MRIDNFEYQPDPTPAIFWIGYAIVVCLFVALVAIST